MIGIDVHARDANGTPSTYEACLRAGLHNAVCITCRIIKPLRSKHCGQCNHCCSTFDHHCPWVNNCVGRGNHLVFTTFIAMVVTAMVLNQYLLVCYLWPVQNQVASRMLFAMLLCMHGFIMSLWGTALLIQNLAMVFTNVTVNERMNAQRYHYMEHPTQPGQKYTPFNRGALMNALTFCKLVAPRNVVMPYPQPGRQARKVTGDESVRARRERGGYGGHNPRGHGHSHGGGGGHGHSHGSDRKRPADASAAAATSAHGHSHGGQPCHGHGGGGKSNLESLKDKFWSVLDKATNPLQQNQGTGATVADGKPLAKVAANDGGFTSRDVNE